MYHFREYGVFVKSQKGRSHRNKDRSKRGQLREDVVDLVVRVGHCGGTITFRTLKRIVTGNLDLLSMEICAR